MKKLLVAVAALVLLTGCVTKDLSVEDRQQIKTLKVLPVFVAVDNFQYTSMTQAWGAGLGAGAGAAAGMASGASTSGAGALTPSLKNETAPASISPSKVKPVICSNRRIRK